MSRESDDNLSSINSTYTDMYQETVKRFTRSSLSPEMDRYSPSRISIKSTSPSQSLKSDADRRTSFDLYLEATGRRRSSDHGAVLTADTEQFIIGQKVWVGGIRPGQIAYIGETHFAPGEWAGIVLDEPNGKNDGCVAGKRYFQCEPKRGIFSRLTRLTLYPLPGASIPTSPILKNSPERSRTVSPTASIRSSFLRSPGAVKNGLTVGDRIIVSSGFGSRPGILRYLGETQFASGNWCGVELDEATGKNDGAVDGIRYFECKPKYGVFVPIAKVSLSPSTKKTRLSRTGSRESLTSIGTMNSIATTNTSRMRMNAQRKSSLIKPVTATPKSQFSMQDLLREKQNHIEQLMIERDLDREDAQNQALQFQKNISELKTRITQLERDLEDERKKSEDLQFSIDEATFCGDELNAQTQVYKEKIHDLERKITTLATETPSLQTDASALQNSTSAISSAIEAANAQIIELTVKLDEQAKIFEVRQAEVQNEEKRLQENIKYLQTENETLQKELLEKDESLEKFSLSESGIDNLRKELALLKEENEKERQQTKCDFTQKLEAKSVELACFTDELTTLKNSFNTLENERTNLEDECEIMRTECKYRDEQLQEVNEQLAKLTAELSMQKAESATLDEMLKAQQQGNVAGKTALEEKICEIGELKKRIVELENDKTTLVEQLHKAAAEMQKLNEMHKQFELRLQEATKADEEKMAATQQLESVMEELKKQIDETNAENEKSKISQQNLVQVNESLKAVEEELRKKLDVQQKLNADAQVELNVLKELNTKLQSDFGNLQENSNQILASKAEEVAQLNSTLQALQAKVKTLEGESTSTVQQMSAKLAELELGISKLKGHLRNKEVELHTSREEHTKQAAILAEKEESLKSAAVALETTNGLFEKLKQEHDLGLKKNQELEENLRKSEEDFSQKQLELGDLTRRYEALNVKCDNLATQNETLQQDILTSRTTGAEVQTEVRKLNAEITDKQRSLADLQEQSNTERLRLESQIEELSQKLTNAGKDFEELKDALHKSKEELAKKNEYSTTMEEKIIKQELSLSDSQRQQENLQIKYEALAAQNESLQKDLTALRSTSTDSNAELLKLTQDIAAKQKAYEELLDKTSSERAVLEGQLQASQQRIDALCNQVETLTQEMKITTEESVKRCELLKQEQEKSGKQELEVGDLTRKQEALNAKCESLEQQNIALQNDLTTLRTASTDSNTEVIKLTEALSGKQKTLQDLTDKASAERLQLESQLQDNAQRLLVSQNDVESLRKELQMLQETKTAQIEEYESLKANSQKALDDLKAKEAAERQKIVETFESQMKNAEQTKSTLDEAISSLQNQIKLLQDELLKSQLDFKAKEEDLSKQVKAVSTEKDNLCVTLQQLESAGKTTLTAVQQENVDLKQSVQKLNEDLKQINDLLLSSNTETEQLKLKQTNSSSELTKLAAQVKSLESALEISYAEIEHKVKLAEADGRKVEDLKVMLEAVQSSNANISATNAELAQALQLLEQEKFETTHIFELFEMESDQNIEQLIEKLSNLKTELAEAQTQLQTKNDTLDKSQISLEQVKNELHITQSALKGIQSNVLEHTSKLTELTQANEELRQSNAEKEAQLQQHVELEMQLAEYKKIFDEMDDASMEKSSKMSALQERIQQVEKEKAPLLEQQKALQIECSSLQRKLEVMDLEKTREIVSLQGRINDLQSINKLKRNVSSSAAAIDGAAVTSDDNDESSAQINFLNSIIADMQKKNETLKAKIEALEALPTDYTQPNAFELIAKRKPAPRVFCDICDEFDKHETEDCPLQASDDREYSPTFNSTNDPLNKKERKLPEPRKYCESCEVFGHEAGECDDECF